MCAFACEHIIIDMPFIMRLHTGMNQGWWQWESYHYVKCWRHHHHHKKEDDEEIDKHLSPTLGLPDDTPDVQNFELRNLEAGDYHRGERGEESKSGHDNKFKKKMCCKYDNDEVQTSILRLVGLFKRSLSVRIICDALCCRWISCDGMYMCICVSVYLCICTNTGVYIRVPCTQCVTKLSFEFVSVVSLSL